MVKYKKITLILILLLLSFGVAGCSFVKISCFVVGHSESDYIYEEGFLCEQDIEKRVECNICGETLRQEIEKQVQHTYVNGVCKICHRQKINIYFNIYEENGIEYINYGRYPQTVVTDPELINRLDQLNQIENLNQNGYIELDGVEYVSFFAEPRSQNYYFSDGTKVEKEFYYFRVEPIKWRILYKYENQEDEVAKLTLLSEKILLSTVFSPTNLYRTVNGKNIMPNNYEFSIIRAWLNGLDGTKYYVYNYQNAGFIKFAFNSEEKKSLQRQSITDSFSDLVWLLSEKDVIDIKYGFPDYTSSSTLRSAEVTDFAIADYAKIDENRKSSWMLRTSGTSNHRSVMMVSASGEVYEAMISFTALEEFGVRPAIILNAVDYK